MSPPDIALSFVARINAGDVDGLVGWMTDDHKFIDSGGMEIVGKELMREGWREYLRMVPNYRIEVHESLAKGPIVVLLGKAFGTYSRDGRLLPEDAWETPAAWRALVKGNLVAEWRVYADNEPVRLRMVGQSNG